MWVEVTIRIGDGEHPGIVRAGHAVSKPGIFANDLATAFLKAFAITEEYDDDFYVSDAIELASLIIVAKGDPATKELYDTINEGEKNQERMRADAARTVFESARKYLDLIAKYNSENESDGQAGEGHGKLES
jgi:hypothetical protein